MMGGRVYTAPINVAAHAAQIDIFELLAGTDKPLQLLAFELGQSTELGDAQEEYIPMALKRVTGAPTSGSGGTAVTPQPVDPNDAASGATLEVGNTTKLSGGTSVELARPIWNVRGGTLWTPPPEIWIGVLAGTRLVLEEVATPADSITGPIGWLSYMELT
jgi:hypothetical protein